MKFYTFHRKIGHTCLFIITLYTDYIQSIFYKLYTVTFSMRVLNMVVQRCRHGRRSIVPLMVCGVVVVVR